ncbi:MAG: VOC family protein [Burkholderiaceae bacterium]|nr:MAG: VOC family protein [Burkholderiaceae bacterium]
MIGYALFGTNDLPRAVAFYDQLFDSLGVQHVWESDRGVAWNLPGQSASFGVILPFDGQPATVGNGCMIALAMKDRAQVDALYAKALSLGATDEGPAGPRGEGFYAGYVRDLDGNKLNFFCFG